MDSVMPILWEIIKLHIIGHLGLESPPCRNVRITLVTYLVYPLLIWTYCKLLNKIYKNMHVMFLTYTVRQVQKTVSILYADNSLWRILTIKRSIKKINLGFPRREGESEKYLLELVFWHIPISNEYPYPTQAR